MIIIIIIKEWGAGVYFIVGISSRRTHTHSIYNSAATNINKHVGILHYIYMYVCIILPLTKESLGRKQEEQEGDC